MRCVLILFMGVLLCSGVFAISISEVMEIVESEPSNWTIVVGDLGNADELLASQKLQDYFGIGAVTNDSLFEKNSDYISLGTPLSNSLLESKGSVGENKSFVEVGVDEGNLYLILMGNSSGEALSATESLINLYNESSLELEREFILFDNEEIQEFQDVPCLSDTDNDSYSSKGTIILEEENETLEDFCLNDANTLIELLCVGGDLTLKVYNCLDGCVSGVCVGGSVGGSSGGGGSGGGSSGSPAVVDSPVQSDVEGVGGQTLEEEIPEERVEMIEKRVSIFLYILIAIILIILVIAGLVLFRSREKKK
jgi:hypothetical protein